MFGRQHSTKMNNGQKIRECIEMGMKAFERKKENLNQF